MLGGLARFSKRSLIATVTFFAAATATAQLFPASLPLNSPSATVPSSSSLATILVLQIPALFYTLVPFLLPAKLGKTVAGFFIGTHFAFGLALAGMTRPSKVISFFYFPLSSLPLSRSGAFWDPSLAMVALGGLLPNIIFWRFVKSRPTPVLEDKWSLSTKSNIDTRLVVGSLLFGVGWGAFR